MATKTKDVGEYVELSPSSIIESALNPRKEFDKAAMKEIIDSIKKDGIVQAILVRPVGKKHEIVCGARRYRAGVEAGLKKIPCNVRTLTDEEAMRICLVENLKRSDLNPLEESDAYSLLLKGGTPVPEIAALVGKQDSYVRQRLVLSKLDKAFRKRVVSREMPLRSAIMVARMVAKDQKELAGMLKEDGDLFGFFQLRDLIHRRFTLRLKNAPFDITDRLLVPKAGVDGSCTTCPSRSGTDQSLFEDLPDQDTCANPACFGDKVRGNILLLSRQCEDKDIKVLPEEQWAKVFPYSSDYVGDGWLDASKEAFLSGKNYDLQKLLNGHLLPVAAFNKSGHCIVLFNEKEAVAKLRELGLIKGKVQVGAAESSGNTAQDDWKIEKLAKSMTAEKLVHEVEGSISLSLHAMIGYAVRIIPFYIDSTIALALLKRRGEKPEKGVYGRDALREYASRLVALAEGSGDWDVVNGLFMELLLCAWNTSLTAGFLMDFGVDVTLIREQAATEFRENKGKRKPKAEASNEPVEESDGDAEVGYIPPDGHDTVIVEDDTEEPKKGRKKKV